MKETIPFYVESKNGHDILDVPQDKVGEEVEKQLKEDKLVTIEQNDGSSEILSSSDMPTEEEKEEWADKFEKTKSATATNKSKGG